MALMNALTTVDTVESGARAARAMPEEDRIPLIGIRASGAQAGQGARRLPRYAQFLFRAAQPLAGSRC